LRGLDHAQPRDRIFDIDGRRTSIPKRFDELTVELVVPAPCALQRAVSL
jgi:hypothetical protein